VVAASELLQIRRISAALRTKKTDVSFEGFACAGAIRSMYHEVFSAIRVELAA